MGERKCPGIDGFCVARQIQRGLDLAFVPASLTAGEEVLAGEDLMNEGVLIGRARGTNTHGLEVGDGDGDETAVEAEDNTTQRNGFGAEGCNVVADGSVGEEVIGAEAEIHEKAVGDGGIWL